MKRKDLHILIADDDALYRKFFKETLMDSEIKYTIVDNGSQAIMELISPNNKFDCVVLDIYMDGIDGIEAGALIRRIDTDLPIIMITGDISLASEVRARAVGISDYMKKPFSGSKFMETLDNALNGESTQGNELKKSAAY